MLLKPNDIIQKGDEYLSPLTNEFYPATYIGKQQKYAVYKHRREVPELDINTLAKP